MRRPSVLIVGYGVVGRNMHKVFDWANIYDLHIPEHTVGKGRHDFAFICVPTDALPDGRADTSIVEQAVVETDAELIIIKSAVPPGTTERLACMYGKRLIVSPEYYGATQHANAASYDFVILGGRWEDTAKVVQLYQHAVPATWRFYQTDSVTAELVKYMENAWLATKVVFCNEFYRIARALGIEYTELRELFLADPRVHPSHTFVYEDAPFFDSHCLNKDVPAIIQAAAAVGYEAAFLRAVAGVNDRWKAEVRQAEARR